MIIIQKILYNIMEQLDVLIAKKEIFLYLYYNEKKTRDEYGFFPPPVVDHKDAMPFYSWKKI